MNKTIFERGTVVFAVILLALLFVNVNYAMLALVVVTPVLIPLYRFTYCQYDKVAKRPLDNFHVSEECPTNSMLDTHTINPLHFSREWYHHDDK